MGMSGGERDDQQFAGNGASADEALDIEEQLSLTGDDDTLPWLEADDDEPEPGSDYRILIFGALAVLALGAILLGARHFFLSGSDGSITPDGSTIAAEEAPYKSRPENPGGEQVAGTGDLSFEVGEGQGREGVVGGREAVPVIEIEPQDVAQPVAAAPSGAPAQANGVGVQVGAYSSRAAAEAGWTQLSGRFEALSGVGHRIIEGTADSGTIYRLQAVASNVAAAETLCRAIRNSGGDCQVKR